jgi:hypothetical protein
MVGRLTTALARVLGVAVAASVVALAAPAHADDQVTVRGTDFPDRVTATLSFVGCSAVYDRTSESLQPYISRGQAPLGTRSLGSLHVVGSMTATTTASLQVHAPTGATGVAYAGYQEPADEGTNLLWFGRADLAAPAAQWHTVDATALSYRWTKYDLTNGQTVVAEQPVPSTVAAFTASRGGDGPGLYTIGFGCDGSRFTIDALRIGSPGAVTTHDLEGLTSAVRIDAAPRTVSPGDPVTITGAVRSGTGNRIPHATVILEERVQGSNEWKRVDVADADPNDASVTVRPQATTHYRWRFVNRPAHEGSVSPVVVIVVVPEGEDDSTPEGTPPAPAPSPSGPASPSQSPSESESQSTSESQSQPAETETSPSPSDEPTSDSAEPSEAPEESPTAVETAAASVTP